MPRQPRLRVVKNTPPHAQTHFHTHQVCVGVVAALHTSSSSRDGVTVNGGLAIWGTVCDTVGGCLARERRGDCVQQMSSAVKTTKQHTQTTTHHTDSGGGGSALVLQEKQETQDPPALQQQCTRHLHIQPPLPKPPPNNTNTHH